MAQDKDSMAYVRLTNGKTHLVREGINKINGLIDNGNRVTIRLDSVKKGDILLLVHNIVEVETYC